MPSFVKNLAFSFLKKAIYGTLGSIATALTLAAGYKPITEDKVELLIWSLVVGGFTGLAAVIKRAATWDPEKAKQ